MIYITLTILNCLNIKLFENMMTNKYKKINPTIWSVDRNGESVEEMVYMVRDQSLWSVDRLG